nr:aldo/keto reductase [Marinicella sp. W31]MDC2880082.1 aldo/keto reductase [Marinicella sp. W31]
MKTNRIGRTAVAVTDVSFGCSSIGNLYREITDGDAEAVLQAAWKGGIRYFDTAPHYGRGFRKCGSGVFSKGGPDLWCRPRSAASSLRLWNRLRKLTVS